MMNSKVRRMKKEILAKNHGSKCHYCDVEQPLNKLSLDHVTPLSKGGSNHIKNLVLSCFVCNKEKADMTPEQFLVWKIERRKKWTSHK